ncbi:MAG: SUMF1/EgtB/PvdO family nonheme iron enzyme [Holophagales bacterium]|nr:SUMF1/EgtB/PvdO family nonheme iron enzyme [Holophagales bacterium]
MAVSVDRFAPGTLLAGRYVVESLLGRGGMGEVYRARDTKLDEVVALKLLPEGAADPMRLRLFLGEVRVARQISHPNVCRVHDVVEAAGLHFMTMELIEGEDLGKLLSRSGPLPVERAVEIGRQACDGLTAAHERGILHRDLKPGNLMVDTGGIVRLADFGLAGLIGSATTGGTPAYMAPELWDHADASVQSDLYALGLVLYELFTGRRAFTGSSTAELAFQHREVTPPPPSTFREGLAPAVERAVLRCLDKDPRRRPRSARAVAAALSGLEIESGRGDASDLGLRPWPPPELPAHPYPVLLPYQHPDLLAGRERDVARLERLLRSPVPIHGLSAPSGTGKSSLLLAGLVPRLRAGGRAVAVDRHPAEPGLAGRLVGDLLEVAAEGGIPVADADAEGFVALLVECETLAGGVPPILVLDQFEDVLVRADAGRARATLGVLLAATCRHRPGRTAPPCRWLLAYREEYHGEVVTWLADATADARREGFPGLDALPHDLSGPERFAATPLPPLGTPAAGSRDPLRESSAVFRAAIEAPLNLTRDGRPRYPWRFADGAADRLARVFAEARLTRPDAPLAPELQVVLSHLLAESSVTHVVEVPQNPVKLVDRALDDHLRRAMEAAFPAGRGAARDRARALLALRELASDTGARKEGRPAAAVERAVGAAGREVLQRLAAPDTRLLVRREGQAGPSWTLSHDRMALAIARLVDEEGRGGGLVVDAELLALRRLVAVETALHVRGEASATGLPGRRYRQISACAEALLWDDDRRAWWAACRKRRRADLGRRAAWSGVAAFLIVAAGLGIASFVKVQAERAALLEQVAKGNPEAAFAALDRGLATSGLERSELLSRLRLRPRPLDVLESGMGGVPAERRARVVLDAAELAMPLLAEAPKDNVRLASLLWALDYAAGGAPDTTEAGRAAQLRDSGLASIRRLHPPPPEGEAGWVLIPSGTFWMGAAPTENRTGAESADEHPRHQVTVSAFRVLDHEVTCAEYRRLVPEHEGDDELPAARVTWYDAYVYAAWLGGRLPTEAEWEYAARAGCENAYCTEGGREARLDEVAWWTGNSAVSGGEPSLHPARGRKPNQRGLFDVYGNVCEWTADWYGPYPEAAVVNPRGPAAGTEGTYRTCRGGSAFQPAVWIHPSGRIATPADGRSVEYGLRPVHAVAKD